MIVRTRFDGAQYDLTPISLDDLNDLTILTDSGVKTVIILYASSVDYNNANVEIMDISYSQDGVSYTSTTETEISGIRYSIYKEVKNVIVGDPDDLIAITIDVPYYFYTSIDDNKIYRKITFKLYLSTKNGAYFINEEENIVQAGCLQEDQKYKYKITYTVNDNTIQDMTSFIARNIEYFSGDTRNLMNNPAKMQYIVSRLNDNKESDYDYYGTESSDSLYEEYKYEVCGTGIQCETNYKKTKKDFPVGRNVIPSGFYDDSYRPMNHNYGVNIIDDGNTVELLFYDSVKGIGYHTFCFSWHGNCVDVLPDSGAAVDSDYIYIEGNLISGVTYVTEDGKLRHKTPGENTDSDMRNDSNQTPDENTGIDMCNDGYQIEYVFNIAEEITSISLPNEVECIGNQAFKNLTSLSSITFGDNSNLRAIGMFAFEGTHSLESIYIPNTVQYIGEGAFKRSGLVSVNIPPQLNRLECGVFRGCEHLAYVDFGCNSSLYKIGTTAFYGCKSLQSITLPNSLEKIENNAFSNCSALTNVVFGHGIRYIGKNAFFNTSIETLDLTTCKGTNKYDWVVLREHSLKNLNYLKVVKLPDFCALDKDALGYNSYAVREDHYIGIVFGKKNFFPKYSTKHYLYVKSLTIEYHSEDDIANNEDHDYVNEEYGIDGLIAPFNYFFFSPNSELYISEFIWSKIQQEPTDTDSEFYGFYHSLWDRFVNPLSYIHSEIYVKDPNIDDWVLQFS